MSPKARIERAARVADRDFENNIEAYLAMYREKPENQPISISLLKVVQVVLWAFTIIVWFNVFWIIFKYV